jgi:flavin-binding protein dodecin
LTTPAGSPTYQQPVRRPAQGGCLASPERGLAIDHDPNLNNRRGRAKMPESTYKIVEIVGTSEVSISKAIDGAIAKASGSLRHLGWFEVGQIRGNIADGKVNRYQVTLKVGFTLE